MSNFKIDLEQEQYPIDFLKKYFFPYIEKQGILQNYIVDKNIQLTGIDIIFHYPNKMINVDIKAQMNRYINNPTPTFCLELEYLKDNIIKQGWLFRSDLATQLYGFIWIDSAICDDKHLIHNFEDINKLTILFVYKSSIISYLESIGFNKTRLDTYISDLKQQKETNGCKQTRLINGLKLFQTLYLSEQPVNLVVPISIWNQLACSKYIITKQNIIALKENSTFCNKIVAV